MKIDKVVFSASELFSPFWNIQSRIWKKKFNIHPVCLFYGDKKKCDMSEEHGDVIEMKFDPNLPDIIKLQFSKFFYPTTEPNTTWITGDIDLMPLQTEYILNGLDSIEENGYYHLNYSMCGQMWRMPSAAYFHRGSRLTGGYDLPAHYHCAKGSLFKDIFFGNRDFTSVVSDVVSSKRYGMIGLFKNEMNVRGDYWVAEETYTSEMLWNYFSQKSFSGFYVKEYDKTTRCLEAKYGGAPGGICPKSYENGKYIYDPIDIVRKRYIEVHCPLPFEDQKDSLNELLVQAGMVD
jgi:hypothetical protein